jgi:hypothetical protein
MNGLLQSVATLSLADKFFALIFTQLNLQLVCTGHNWQEKFHCHQVLNPQSVTSFTEPQQLLQHNHTLKIKIFSILKIYPWKIITGNVAAKYLKNCSSSLNWQRYCIQPGSVLQVLDSASKDETINW